MKASPLTAAERDRIIALLPSGKSCRAIAKEVGRSPHAVSRVAKRVGHVWGALNTQQAAQARHAYSEERRINQALVLGDKLDAVLPRLDAPTELIDFSAPHRQHVVRQLDRPDPRQLRELATAVKNLTSALKDLLPEASGESLTAVQEYLRRQKGPSTD